MEQKTVSELIFEKFQKTTKKDKSLSKISSELTVLIREKKIDRTKIKQLLGGILIEDS